MKALIIYDSFFGNTEQIAGAIGKALDARKDALVMRVSEVKLEQLTGLELLIVGSPTRGFRPGEAITNFLKSIPRHGLKGFKVAAFDTRLTMSIIPPIFRFIVNKGGYAAKLIADMLKEKGGELIVPPEGFYVEKSEGPLKEGELERATDWAKQISESK